MTPLARKLARDAQSASKLSLLPLLVFSFHVVTLVLDFFYIVEPLQILLLLNLTSLPVCRSCIEQWSLQRKQDSYSPIYFTRFRLCLASSDSRLVCPMCRRKFDTIRREDVMDDATEHGSAYEQVLAGGAAPATYRRYYPIAGFSPNSSNLNLHQCAQCSRRFGSLQALQQHRKSKHSRRCPHCEASFSVPERLRKHFRKCHSFDCSSCNSSFPSNVLLQEHRMSEHSIKCNKCAERFVDPSDMLQHWEKTHQVFLSCHLCQQSFPNHTSLDAHMHTRHAEHEHICPICFQEFPDRRSSRGDFFGAHEGVHRRKCKLWFENWSDCRYHLQFHHT